MSLQITPNFSYVVENKKGRNMKEHQQRCNYCLNVLIHDSLYLVSVVHFPGGSEEELLPLLPPWPAAVAEGC